MKLGSTIRIRKGEATELVTLRRRAKDGLQVQRAGGSRIWINDTQVLAVDTTNHRRSNA